MAFITTTANSISSGGTISGSITIEGDLTVNGDGAGAYDEIVDGNLRISSTNKLEFGDTGTYIHQSADGVLDLVSDTEIEINATTIDVNGAMEVSGTLTASDDLVVSDELRPYEIRADGTSGVRLANSQGGIVGYLGLRSSGNYGSGLKLEDDIGSIIFGSDSDYSVKYDSTSDALEIIEGITSASETVLFSINSDSVISLSNNDLGTGNTLFGKDTGDAIASGGNYNVAIGQDALGENTTADASTAIGYESQLAQNGGYNTTVGYQSMKLTGGGTCYSNVGIGSFALYRHSGQYAVAIGEAAGYTNSAHYTTAIGAESLRNNTDGQFNTAVGYGSLKTNVDGDKNTAIGYKSLFTFEADTDGHGLNSALGWESGMDLTTGTENTLVGATAGGNLTDGDQNTALGAYALGQTIAGSNHNTALGYYACGAGDITNSGITAVGAYALAENVGGQKNVAVGFQAGNVLTAGSQNTIVGYDADTDDNSATNQTVIGSEVTGVADNSVTLGNASVTAVYMASDSGAVVHCSGVNFPDTPVESADANTLDDYEEGLVTNLAFAFGGNSVGQTYNSSRQQARYTKVGNRVFVGGWIEISDKGSSTGAVTITGLPFTVQDHLSANTGGAIGYMNNISFADFPMLTAPTNTTTLQLYETTNSGATTTLTEANLDTSGSETVNFMFGFHYNTQ